MYDPFYEANLENLSLKYLYCVSEDVNGLEVKLLAEELIKHITRKGKIFSIKATGNYGIALNSILFNNLYSNKAAIATIALVSHWSLTNHLKYNDFHHLILFHRGDVVKNNFEVFTQLYKNIVAETTNRNTIDGAVALSTVDLTIRQLFMFDFYQIKDELDYYDRYEKIVDTGAFGFLLGEEYQKIHRKIEEYVYNIFNKE